jgi:hypothetical protein
LIKADPVDMKTFPPQSGSWMFNRAWDIVGTHGPGDSAESSLAEGSLARTAKASSTILREASAELSTRYVKDDEGCWNDSAACPSIANQKSGGADDVVSTNNCEDATSGKSPGTLPSPRHDHYNPEFVCVSSEAVLSECIRQTVVPP